MMSRRWNQENFDRLSFSCDRRRRLSGSTACLEMNYVATLEVARDERRKTINASNRSWHQTRITLHQDFIVLRSSKRAYLMFEQMLRGKGGGSHLG
jgi:hypothetical protein